MLKEMRNKEGEHSLIGFTAFCQSRSSLLLQTPAGHPATPRFGLGPWIGARVASQRCPTLRQADPIIVEEECLCWKFTHAIRRVDLRSPINDPGENFSPCGCRIPNYTTQNILASPAGKGVQTSRPRRRLPMSGFQVATHGRFWGGH